MKKLIILVAMIAGICGVQAGDRKTETVIVITLDGLRWQEIFRGAEPVAFEFEKEFDRNQERLALQARLAPGTAEERRARLMPFVWGTIAQQGVLLGNRDAGSRGTLHNDHHNSYPGYSEMLTGVVEPRIEGNKKIPNPNWTVAEFLNNKAPFKGRIAAFGSWETFSWIYNRDRSGLLVSAGHKEGYLEPGNAVLAEANRLQALIPDETGSVRDDIFTMTYARAALASGKKAFVGIHFDETDHFTHAGKYDQYLKTIERQDGMIAELWAWLQSDERYAGKTTLILTVDHGRGDLSRENPSGWHGHGGRPGDDAVWLAAIGPDTPASGVLGSGSDFDLGQVAATVASLLGETFVTNHESLKAAPPIGHVAPE